MTTAYSATLYGMKDHCREFILEKNKDSYFSDLNRSANMMGDEIWKSIGGSLKRQTGIMNWFQACCKVFGTNNLPFSWINSTGNICTHNVNKQKKKQVQVHYKRNTTTYTKMIDTKDVDVSKMVSGCAANIIHSNDSGHLDTTVVNCKKEGITDLWFVHDSFGSHYDDAQPLLENTRKAWVSIYEERNILEELYEYWTDTLLISGGKGVIPHYTEFFEMGNLDNTAVNDSDWFFC